MTENKRYYWLKLKEDFFDDETIIYLEEQEGGIFLVNFYLKLALKSLRDDGKLLRIVGERAIPYDTRSLARLTRVQPEIVEMGLEVFKDIGLIEITDSEEIYLKQIDELVGSESDVARRVRKSRAKAKNNTMLQCNTVVTKCNTEKEIEKEIEKDIEREKEKRVREEEKRVREEEKREKEKYKDKDVYKDLNKDIENIKKEKKKYQELIFKNLIPNIPE